MPRTTTPIRKLPSGRYQVRYRDMGGAQRKASFATRREAVAFLDRTRTEVRSGTYVDRRDGQQRWSEFLAEWLSSQHWAKATTATHRADHPRPCDECDR